MRKSTLVAIIILCIPQEVYALTAADVESVINKSKVVDAQHPVKAVISGDNHQAIISTFCSPHSTDKDCKITALLIMKELTQHCMGVQVVQVTFFDEVDPRRSRTLRITEGHAGLLDRGKKAQEVLDSIRISYGDAVRRVEAEAPKTDSNPAESNTWNSPNIYELITQAGERIVAEEAVTVQPNNPNWTPTNISVTAGEKIWIDTRPGALPPSLSPSPVKDDQAGTNPTSTAPGQSRAVLLGKLDRNGTIFAIGMSRFNYKPTGLGRLSLILSNNSGQGNIAAQTVRVILAK